MDYELEIASKPVPGSFAAAMAEERAAGEQRLDDEAYERLMAMGYDGGEREGNQWIKFLVAVHDPDLGSDTVDDEGAIDAMHPGFGWIEDTHGGAAFVPYDLDDEDNKDGL